jgi:hypothetical protein
MIKIMGLIAKSKKDNVWFGNFCGNLAVLIFP